MMDPDTSAQQEWIEGAKNITGFRGIMVVLWAVACHIVTLQWLKAPRWKNREEARAELSRIVAEHEAHNYAFWAVRVDKTKRLEFTTEMGTWYQATIQPFWDDKPHGAIRVLLSIDDGGIGAYYPMTDSLLLEPPEPDTRVAPE